MSTTLEQSILRAVCYFDVFAYPLTLLEIHRWLPGEATPVQLSDLRRALAGDYLAARVASDRGFYYLVGRQGIVATRLERYQIAEAKFKKATRIVRILSYFPFVRFIGICNTLAYSNSASGGDIDLFFIVDDDHIWRARLLVLSFLRLFGLRPTARCRQDKICSTFFITANHLNIKDIALPADYYLIHWLTQVWPVYGQEEYEAFIVANAWLKELLPRARPVQPVRRRTVAANRRLKRLLAAPARLLPERWARVIQRRALPPTLTAMANRDSRVVVNDQMLKFHQNDRRELYNAEFLNRLKQVL